MSEKQKVALVLSGGGARGLAHIGVIEVLEENGYEISSLAGTSMGSLVGGVYAIGKLSEFKQWVCEIDKKEMLQLIDFSFSSAGLVKGDRVLDAMQQFIEDAAIEDLKIPYAAIATDLNKKQEIVFDKGSVFDAIRASIAIPSVFTPIEQDEQILVDGGVLNNIPVRHVKRTKNDLLVAVNVNADIAVQKPKTDKSNSEQSESVYQEKLKEFGEQIRKINPFNNGDTKDKLNYFNLITRTINVMTFHISKLELENNPPDVLVEVSNEICGTFDFLKAEELIEAGREAARKSLKEYN